MHVATSTENKKHIFIFDDHKYKTTQSYTYILLYIKQ